ncbi:uncharacterized protein LOC100179724 isoform X1 [Ciona intestinalis]
MSVLGQEYAESVHSEMKQTSIFSLFCESCTTTKLAGKILRTLVVVFNILIWFAGCAVVSVSVWLLFIDHAMQNYYLTFPILNTGLFIVLGAGILLLVISFVGTCGANMKSQMLVTLSMIAILLITVAEVVGLIFFVQNQQAIRVELKNWYDDKFLQYTEVEKSKATVDHIQKTLECCGLSKSTDFINRLPNITAPPSSCNGRQTLEANRVTQPIHPIGCQEKLKVFANLLLNGWPIWFSVSILMIMEVGAFLSAMLYLLYLIRRGRYEYDDDDIDDESELIGYSADDVVSLKGLEEFAKTFPLLGDLPKPKIIRIVRSSKSAEFGFQVMFDDIRNCHVIVSVQQESIADFASLKTGSQLIEINGLMAHTASSEEIQYKLDLSGKEIRLLVVDAMACVMYEERNVEINLRNVEGVTDESIEYRPRLCKIVKGDSGFGFHLLYLEDRNGEYIEDVTTNGAAEKAGLKIGDRILEVNGVNIEKERSRDVVERIRMSGSAVYLLVVDPKTDGFYRKKAVSITASLAADYFAGRIAPTIPTPKPKRKRKSEVKPRYCRLLKRPMEEFGLYVVIDNSRIGQVIRWVDCGGAADRAGLRIGDRIVEVNGQNVEYEPHQRLISAIGLSKNAAHLIVVDEDYDRAYKRNKPRLCRIFKDSDVFGFGIEYIAENDGHYITDVEPNGPAERAGLKVGDRAIQINGVNIDRRSHDDVLSRLRSCEGQVVLLVIDHKSAKHYKRISEFKQTGMDDIDYDAISIPDEPVFIPKDSESELFRTPAVSMADSISMTETKSYASIRSDASLKNDQRKGLMRAGEPRKCTIRKNDNEEHGFFLAIDRDRNGQIIRRVVKGGPADRAGLCDGDRILIVNNEPVETLDHEEVVSRIRECGNVITLTVIDERSDNFTVKPRPYLYRVMKDKGGYGFYLWYDDKGHFVQEITTGSPADKAGLCSGDRLVEINGINIENETHEDVFYRIKACVNVVTMLALDTKTYVYCKKNGIEINARTAEGRFSGETGWSEGDTKKDETVKIQEQKKKKVQHEVVLRKDRNEEGYGFHLAFSNSFSGDDNGLGGHVVHWVGKGGPADLAGVRDGDKIISVNGTNVIEEDHEQVMVRIHANGQNTVRLGIEYIEDVKPPHDVEIYKENESFGFCLWFDENGHYIEDVTIGSTADRAGLKIGDRLIQVNQKNVESETHDATVELVRSSKDVVVLNVVNVRKEEVRKLTVVRTCHVSKYAGSYGFSIQEDVRGLYIEFVKPSSPAEHAGLHMGDRLVEINGQSAEGLELSSAIRMIIQSQSSIDIMVLSSKKETTKSKTSNPGLKLSRVVDNPSTTSIFHQLLGKEEIDYVVEKREYGNAREGEKKGTDLRSSENKPKREMPTKVSTLRKHGNKKMKRTSSIKKKKGIKLNKKNTTLKTKYTKGDVNVVFEDEEAEKSSEEGGFLDFTLKKVEKHLTKGRTKSQKKRSFSDKSEQLEGSGSTGKNILVDGNNVQFTRKVPKFHLATSGTLRWKFDETDSRRPGHIVTRTIGEEESFKKVPRVEDIDEENEIQTCGPFDSETTPTNILPDDDLMMISENTELNIPSKEMPVNDGGVVRNENEDFSKKMFSKDVTDEIMI